jgi:hypothetical protein
LARGPLTAKTLVYERRKSLDFLGFSRPNQAFSIGYAGVSLKEISRAFARSGRGAGTTAPVFGKESAELLMRGA